MKSRGLDLDTPAHYRICVQGRFDARWLDMLSGVWVICRQRSSGRGVTILIGEVVDQAALVGVIEQLYNLGFPIISVEHLSNREQTGT